MRWPWQREKREANSYTDSRVLASLRDAEGASATVHETAALEAAAGLYSFCLSGSVQTPYASQFNASLPCPACP